MNRNTKRQPTGLGSIVCQSFKWISWTMAAAFVAKWMGIL